RSVPLFRSLQAKLDTLNRVVRERLAGMRVIRAFDRIEHEHRRFEAANEDLTGTAIRANRLMAVMMPLMMLVMNLTIVAIVWFGSRLIAAERLEVGDLMAFIQYAMQIMFSLLMVSMLFAMIPRAAVSAGRINEVLDTAPTIVDRPAPQAAANAPSDTESEPPGIAFAGVRFGYPGAAEPVLSDVSFRAPRGRVTALIGGTGAGKSTIVNLIMRFYDIDAGRVCIDGVDVREWSQAALRAKIGLVPQKAVLFTGSVAENIRYGDEHASDEAVQHAAQIAQAAEFIDELPERYGAPVTQGGTNLSGGQRQRLAIARAIVRRPKIYVLDDCFSALDFRTDARLRAALRAETGNATVLIVAQRVSTVMHADQVIVLDEGHIVGIGTHRELLQTCGVYREIVASQLDEEEIA
ncbi:MAG TPA: ABC transporter ATP-binding protein, partial [Limnochordia bacterium]|nr:ABC transporter ATP-binding protein [Limnochordia bacterium]